MSNGTKFKVGDLVCRVEPPPLYGKKELIQGGVYKIIRVDQTNDYPTIHLEGLQFYYDADKFVLIADDKPKSTSSNLTLPTDSVKRKDYPLFRGCLRYFPAALAGIAKVSKQGNDKHNPGQEMHHARGKSPDHGDCILRHLVDVQDLLAALKRGDTNVTQEAVLAEVSQMAWRALALSQELHEQFGAPLAPGAKNE